MSVLRDGTRGSSESKHVLALGDRNATAALERAGHVAAPTIEVALEELANGRFDCLLIDVSGPRGVDRLDGVERLRDEHPMVPIVAFCDADAEARAAIDAGVNDVVRAGLGSLSVEELADELEQCDERDGAGRHEAIADLGQRALDGAPSTALAERAVTLVAEALAVDRCGAFELVPEEGSLLLREGVGWESGAVGDLAIDADGGSQAARALSVGEPAVGVLESEAPDDSALASRGVASGISVAVGPAEEPWGVLGAYATDRRPFDDSDVGFVRSVANVLAGAVDRERADGHRLESELEEVYGRVTDAFVALDPDARVTHLNDRAERLLGLPAERLVGTVIWEPFPEVFEETFREDYWEAMETQEPIECERYYPFLDRWYEGRAYPSESGLSVYFRDITERKRTERQLREERTLKDRILETSPIGIGVTDSDGRMTFVNDRAAEIFGHGEAEILTRSHDDGRWNAVDWNGDPLEPEELPFTRVKRNETLVFDEQLGVERPDGGRIWLSTNCAPLFDANGEFDGAIYAFEDVTDRRRLENELGELLGRVTDGFFGLDAEWRFTFLNERAEELINPEGLDLVGESIWELFPEAVGMTFEEQYRRAMETQQPVTFEEYFEPLGTWFSVRAYPSESGLSCYFRDVTEQRRLEGELEEMLGRVTDAFYALDAEWRFTHVNERAEELIDFEGEGLVGKHVWETFEWAADSRIGEEYERAMETQEPTSFEIHYPDPLDRWFEINAYPSESGLSVYFRDVTERREREQELERYETTVETIWDGVATLDPEECFVMVNEAFCELTGYDREELLGEHVTLIHDEPVNDVAASLAEEVAASDRDVGVLEFDLLTADGETITVEGRFGPYRHADGTTGRTGVVRDVTERKERELALRAERDLIERIVETSPVGIVTLDADGGFDLVNDRAEAILGYPRDELEEFAGSTDVFEPVGSDGEPLAPEEIPTHRLIAEGETFHDVEMGLRSSDGDRVWLSVSATPLCDEDGATAGGVITFADVTERREHERELERYKRYTDDILDAIDDVFYVLDGEGRLRRWNASGTHVTGYTDVEGASMHALEFFAEHERESVADAITAGFETGHARVEADLVTKDGESVPYEFNASALENPDGEPVLVGIGRDVTERKEATAELRRRIDQQAAVARLGQLALETDDLDSLFQETSEIVARVLDNAYCKVLDLDPDDRELLLRRGVGWRDGIAGAATVAADENSQAGYTLHSEEPVIVDDLDAETRFSGPELLTSHGVVSGISVIIGPAENPWGILGTHDVERREFTAYDADFVQSVANVLANAIDRIEHEQELERYETIVETVNDGIYTIDETGRFTSVNRTYASMLGYDRADLVGTHASMVVDDEVIDAAREIGESMRAGETEAPCLEATLRTASGECFEAEATFALLPEADGGNERVGVVRDITDRKRMERQLRLSAEALHELYELTTSRELPFEEKLGRVLEAGCERLGLEYGIFTRIEDDTMTIVQSHADHELYQPGTSCPLSRSYCRRVLEKEGLVVVDDALEEGWSGDPAYETFELGTYVGGQVVIDGEVYGTICFTSSDPRGEPLSEVERTFVELVNGWASYELERSENQRELERQREQLASLDQLNAVIRDISHSILDTTSREGIETAVCERLADRYLFAWIGGVGRGTNAVSPTAAAGVGEDYLDGIDISLARDDPSGRGPTAEAIRSREPKFRTNVLEDPEYEPWHESARERGYRSSAAIPIQYEESLYGVLNVYSTHQEAFGGTERDVLMHLGEIVGHTIYAVEQRKALTSDTMLELEFRLEDTSQPLVEAASEGGVEIAVERLIPGADGALLQFVTVTGMSSAEFSDAIGRYESVERATLLSEDDDGALFELRTSESPLADALSGFGGRIANAMVTDGEFRVIAELPPDVDVRAVVTAIDSASGGAELLAQRTEVRDRTTRQELQNVLTDRLTDKQRAALETSYFAGYFDWPRGHTGEEVAELLGLSPATLSQHLRIAERKLFDSLFAEA